eukprot:TRINITY_DN14951_c0_g1_i1.p1 TRINITY_DN14951_c0_g1~~TRINITY_DN14951_c0_g1_i1.p1  ORF type:complete len:461 (+),score=103.32 TRINITY_DN14951_c0_g1_i1:44-1384(+)
MALAVRKSARAALRRKFQIDGDAMVPSAVLRKSAGRDWTVKGLHRAMEKSWPLSERGDKQMLLEVAASRQSKKETFSPEYYHFSYESYLGNTPKYAEAHPLVMKRMVHWTETLLCLDSPSLPVLRKDLLEAGVNVRSSYEEYTTWMVGMCYRAMLRPAEWESIKSEMQDMQKDWVAGSLSERWSVGVAVHAKGWEMRDCFEMLRAMSTSSTLFTERAYQLLVVKGGVKYDIINGFSGDGPASSAYQHHCAHASSQVAGVHALLIHALRAKKPNIFWWCVRLYDEMSSDLGMLPTDTVHLIFFMWVYGKDSMHPLSISSILTIFAQHGLPEHVVAVLQEYINSSPSAPLSVNVARVKELFYTDTTVDQIHNFESLLSQALAPQGTALIPVTEGEIAQFERHSKKKAKRRVKPIPREKIEAASVRELLRNAPFGGDDMVHRYITVSNM